MKTHSTKRKDKIMQFAYVNMCGYVNGSREYHPDWNTSDGEEQMRMILCWYIEAYQGVINGQRF